MHVVFRQPDLDRLEKDQRFDARLPTGVVKSYRKVMGWIRAAKDERDLRSMKSLHFEKLRGDRSHQYSMRLNDQFRIIVELERIEENTIIEVVEVIDYH